jgi:hypothetical protein
MDSGGQPKRQKHTPLLISHERPHYRPCEMKWPPNTPFLSTASKISSHGIFQILSPNLYIII